MTNNLLWQNNIWKDIDNSFLSIKDRGLRFSDGIFETILIYRGKVKLLNKHLSRLKLGASILKMSDYHTFISGKWHLGGDVDSNPIKKGFDQSFL